ncbi:Pyridox-oxase-2 domain-containing protein [Mycena kentingensis (nom. inval.)]|nr:Pyridox-oxase-2 domain-containing protein [Mycena kentingensis (nom. inval.)]
MQMTAAAPRWKLALEKALAAFPKATGAPDDGRGRRRDDVLLTVVQFASVDATELLPHVRSLIFRGFVCPSGDAGQPVVLATTDARSPKTTQLIANPHVQIAWWIEGAQEQYRIAGTARVVPAPSNALYWNFVHGLAEAEGEARYDWEAKRVETWRAMSPYMKASWCRPAPGLRLADVGGKEEAKRWPEEVHDPKEAKPEEREEKERLWVMSLENFALVLIEPTEVDRVELAPVPNVRTRYWKDGEGVWRDEELVP